MSKTIRVMIAAIFTVYAAFSHALTLKADAPERYTVVKGDTLWGISERYTDSPWHWPDIWYQNEQIEDPHLIYPGDVIGLIMVDGKMKVAVVSRGEASRTVKLTPTARVEPIESAIPTIPMDAVAPFISNNRIVKKSDLQNAPYIVSAGVDRVISGAGEEVYARGDFSEGVATAYGVFRASTLYRDPKTNEVLGLEAREIGQGEVITQTGNLVKLELTRTRQHVKEGDRLLTTENRTLVTRFQPKTPEDYVEGVIINVPDGVTQIGQYTMVVLNLGLRDGVEEGAMLDVMKKGEVVRDKIANKKIRLPAEKAGQLMVFRAYEKLSYALILKASSAITVGDQVQSPY